MPSSVYQLSRLGFVTTISLDAHTRSKRPFVSVSLGGIIFIGVILTLLVFSVLFYFIQVNFLHSAGAALENQRSEYDQLQEEHARLSSQMRASISLENLEYISAALSMEKAEANFIDIAVPIFVAK